MIKDKLKSFTLAHKTIRRYARMLGFPFIQRYDITPMVRRLGTNIVQSELYRNYIPIKSWEDIYINISLINEVKSKISTMELIILGLVEIIPGGTSVHLHNKSKINQIYFLWKNLLDRSIITQSEFDKYLILIDLRDNIIHNHLYEIVLEVEDDFIIPITTKEIKYTGKEAFTSMFAFFHMYHKPLCREYDEFIKIPTKRANCKTPYKI